MRPTAIVLAAALILPGEAAVACKMLPCPPQEPGLVAAGAKLLIRGRLQRILTESGREAAVSELEQSRGLLELEVLDVWRGDVPPRFHVLVTFQNGANCGRGYHLGEEYVLWSFAEIREGETPEIRNCDGIGPGGWPEESWTDVETFSRALGSPSPVG